MNAGPRSSTVIVAGRVQEAALSRIAVRAPGVDLVRLSSPTSAIGRGADAEILLVAGLSGAEVATVVARLPRLRWVHACSSGVDRLVAPGVLRENLRLTRTSRARAEPMAEYVIAATLALYRRLPELLAAQREQRWQRLEVARLAGATVGFVGAGAVARAAARRFRAFDTRVLVVRGRSVAAPEFDAVWGPARLLDLLAAADVVVVACALTPETHRLIGPRQLAAMKRSAVLVNVARGAVIDEQALVDALQRGAIAGAALDVFEHEPLPASSPLWRLPGVIVTPHQAGAVPGVWEAVADEFLANLERFVAGEALVDEVSRG